MMRVHMGFFFVFFRRVATRVEWLHMAGLDPPGDTQLACAGQRDPIGHTAMRDAITAPAPATPAPSSTSLEGLAVAHVFGR